MFYLIKNLMTTKISGIFCAALIMSCVGGYQHFKTEAKDNKEYSTASLLNVFSKSYGMDKSLQNHKVYCLYYVDTTKHCRCNPDNLCLNYS